MVLFFSTLSLLIFSDLFIIDPKIMFILYIVYMFIYIFYNKGRILILPNKYLFKGFVLNTKQFLSFLYYDLFCVLFSISRRTFKWKPLFKRSSYFGLYRSARNQWLNK